MWDDIADTADRYLEDPTAHVRHRHFLGPIVLDQQHFEAGASIRVLSSTASSV